MSVSDASVDPAPVALVVDDDARNLKLAQDVLRAAGFRTLGAATGAAGVALAVEHLPDVILMDLRLPDMDGTDAARILGEDVRTSAIPVVMLSAATLRADAAWLAHAGFAGCLEKPIDIAEFPGQVLGFCRASRG
jgi:two-component system, cell cycle response regulator DivK